MYKVKNKYGKVVEVDEALYNQLIESGKRKEDDFTEVSPVKGDVTARATRSIPYRTQLQKLRQEEFREMPWYDQALAGAGKVGMQTVEGLSELASGAGPRTFYGADVGQITQQGRIAKEYEQERARRAKERQETYKVYDEAAAGSLPASAGEFGMDLGLTAIPAMKGAKLGQLRKAPGTIKSFLGGLGAGAGSSAVHQTQRVGAGYDPSIFGAVAETGLSGAIPGAGSKIAPLLKRAGKEITKTVYKKGGLKKGKITLDDKEAETLIKKYGKMSPQATEEAILNAHRELSQDFSQYINRVPKDKRVPLMKILDSTIKRFERKKKTASGVNLSQVNRIIKKIEGFKKDAEQLMDSKGTVSFKTAQNFKRDTLDDLAKWDTQVIKGDIKPHLTPPAEAAREARRKLMSSMEKIEPDVKPYMKKYREIYALEPYIKEASERAQRNRKLSLADLGSLRTAVLGGGAAYAVDQPWLLPLSMIPFAAGQIQKSPAAAQSLYKLGQGLGSKPAGALGHLGLHMGRSGIYGGGQ